MRPAPSVRATLIYWLLLPTIALWISAIAIVRHFAFSISQNAYDDGLSDDAEALSSFVKKERAAVSFDAPPQAQHLLARDDDEDFRYEILDANQGTVAKNWPEPPGIGPPFAGFSNFRLGSREFRIFALPISERNGGEIYAWVRVAESTADREALAKKITIHSLLPLSGLLILSVFVVFVAVKRGLRPVDVLSAAVSARSPQSLRPIELTNVPTEVIPLVKSLNSLLHSMATELKEREQFVARVAHQMKTPIAAFRAQVEAIERRHSGAEFLQDIENLNLSSARIGRLMTQLLTLSRAEPAESLHEAKPVDLRAILELICRERAFAAGEKRIEISLVGKSGISQICGEEQGTYDIAANLIDNALQYSPNGSRVEIAIEAQQHQVRLVVRDSGPGIAESEQSRIFERFYRIPGTTGTGNGLGLSIVKELTIKLEATIEVQCPGELGGTDFIVVFPKENRQTKDQLRRA